MFEVVVVTALALAYHLTAKDGRERLIFVMLMAIAASTACHMMVPGLLSGAFESMPADSRDNANISTIAWMAVNVLLAWACCLVSMGDRRRSLIPFVYAMWQVVEIVVLTVMHYINWYTQGVVSDGVVAIFQLLCVGADVSAAWLYGCNPVSRVAFSIFGRGDDHRRRANDMASLESNQ